MKTIVGIIGAMDEELAPLIKEARIDTRKEIAGLTFFAGQLYEKDIVLVKCGIGKVNAAICTQALIDHFHVNAVINVGVAGAVFHELNIGDIVISKDTVQHDMDASAFGDPVGSIPRMEESYFKADEALLALADSAAKGLKLANAIIIGRVASGDQFIASQEGKKRIWDTVQGYCAEMEGAAIAQACYLNKVPFVLLRAISDNAEGDTAGDYAEFADMAAKNAAMLLCSMLQAMD